MEGVGSEVSQKIRSAIKAKLVELGTYVDEELPDYIMVLVANNKTKDQMDDDLSLFLGHNTERFTSWLHHVLQKLNAASMLKPPPPQEPKKKEENKTPPEPKKKEDTKVKPFEKDEKDKKGKKGKQCESKQKPEKEKKDKKNKKGESKSKSPSPPPPHIAESTSLETGTQPEDDKKDKDKEKEKPKGRLTLDRSKRNRLPSPPKEVVKEKDKSPPAKDGSVRRSRRGTNKTSSADIFQADVPSTADDQPQSQKDEEEQEQLVDDFVELKADMNELDLELEDEPAPKKLKTSKDDVKEHKKSKEAKNKPTSSRKLTRDTSESEKVIEKEKVPVKEKASVLDRLGASVTGRRVINLREESSFPPRASTDVPGMARAVSSAITMAVSSTTGKKIESRVRSTSRERRSSANPDERRTSSGRRIVSTVGAVLRRLSSSKDEDEEEDEEEYDPKKPQLSGIASKVEVAPRPKRPGSIQANTALILRAMADAHKSTNRSQRHRNERGPDRDEPPPKKQKGELFTKSYRKREQSRQSRDIRADDDSEVRIRKIAITVPNSMQLENENPKSSSIVKHDKRSVEKEKAHELSKSSSAFKILTEEEREEQELLQAVVNSRKGGAARYKVSEDILVVEEEEEEEEEIIDEPMEDELPSLPVPKSITVSNPTASTIGKASGERTRFIVTLEGVDQANYGSSGRVDLRSRLGPIPSRQLPHQESMEEVEEYIEEVEEWEEEEEEEDGMLCSREAIPVSTSLKSRLNAPAPEIAPTNVATKLERCRYWPACTQGESCVYHHPSKQCKAFPNCTFGEKCLFIHPNCRFDSSCTRKDCAFTHASTRHIPLPAAKPPGPAISQVKCRFFPKCTNMSCPFLHPRVCKFGSFCKKVGCYFAHPDITTGPKLKWIAPKTTTTTTTTTATILQSAIPTAKI